MQRIVFDVRVTKEAALAALSPHYGDSKYEPSETELPELTRAQALWAESNRIVVAGVNTSWASIKAAIVAGEAEEQKAREERAQEKEAAILAWLAKPAEELLLRRYTYEEFYVSLGDVDVKDPRVAARYADLQAQAKTLNEAEAVEKAARKEAQEREEQARKAVAESEMKEFLDAALDVPALARARKEGYPVATQLADHVANAVADSLDVDWVLVSGTDEYEAAEWSTRPAPSPEAFAALDRVKAVIAEMRLSPHVDVEVSEIRRYRDCEEGDWRTVVMVQVDYPGAIKTRYVVVPAE